MTRSLLSLCAYVTMTIISPSSLVAAAPPSDVPMSDGAFRYPSFEVGIQAGFDALKQRGYNLDEWTVEKLQATNRARSGPSRDHFHQPITKSSDCNSFLITLVRERTHLGIKNYDEGSESRMPSEKWLSPLITPFGFDPVRPWAPGKAQPKITAQEALDIMASKGQPGPWDYINLWNPIEVPGRRSQQNRQIWYSFLKYRREDEYDNFFYHLGADTQELIVETIDSRWMGGIKANQTAEAVP